MWLRLNSRRVHRPPASWHMPGQGGPARAPAMPALPATGYVAGAPRQVSGRGARGRLEAAAERGRVELIYKARRAPALRAWQKKS